ncbi:MAG: DUF4369 domain-containing protein [Bacteroidales bacterium]|nr:DUF4369 domain-containing protein [Bacteroidales bacterium]
MKKIFSLIALMALIVSCGGTKPYKIDGTISAEGFVDGDTISLGYSVDGASYTPESYAVIKDGKFEFTGNVENSKLYYLVNHKTEEPLVMFFLESGDIKATIDNEKSNVEGTPSNDIYTELQENLTGYISQLQEKQISLYIDTTLTEEQREGILSELQTLSEKASEIAKNFVTSNIETLPGLFMLVQCANMFDDEEFDALVQSIPEKNIDEKNNCLYAVLLDIQEQRKNPQDFSEYFKAATQESDTTTAETPADE